MAPRSLSCSLAVLALVLFARPAHAEWAQELSADMDVDWFRELPSQVKVDPSVMTSRALTQGGRAAVTGPLWLAGGGGGWGLVVDDWLLVPLLTIKIGGAVGSSTGTLNAVDGTLVRTEPWSALFWELGFPGLGVRYRYRSLALQARLEPQLGYVDMIARFYSGPSQAQDDRAGAFFFILQARAEGCWRLDPVQRVCAFVAPNLWEQKAFNGGTAGVRGEIDIL